MEDDMKDLIARLEAAEVGARELDHLIFMHTAPMEVSSHWSPNDRMTLYTTSLDAALALAERVLPGWGWCMRTDETGQCFANVFPGNPNIDRIFYDAYAATHPIALCIAILRAKIENANDPA